LKTQSREVALKAFNLINKLASNILIKKQDKFRTIKTTNKTLGSKIFAFPPAV
jgi:hypothetical protein